MDRLNNLPNITNTSKTKRNKTKTFTPIMTCVSRQLHYKYLLFKNHKYI